MKKTILIFAVVLMALSVSVVFAESDAVAQARENFLKAQSNYELAKADWIAARQIYIDAKKMNTTNITFPIEKSKAFLEKITEHVIARIEVIKARVADAKVLSDSEKASMTAQLNADRAALSALEAEAQNITTTDQFKTVSEKIRIERNKDLKDIATILGTIGAEHGARTVQVAQNTSAKVQKYIDTLKSKGADTSSIESMLAEYNNDLTLASASFADAKNKFAAGSDKEGREALKAGTEHIKDAQKVLKAISGKMKELTEKMKEARKDITQKIKEERKIITKEIRNNRTSGANKTG